MFRLFKREYIYHVVHFGIKDGLQYHGSNTITRSHKLNSEEQTTLLREFVMEREGFSDCVIINFIRLK